MVPCEVTRHPLQIRYLSAITTPGPMRPQRQSCSTWLALSQLRKPVSPELGNHYRTSISVHGSLMGGTRRRPSRGKLASFLKPLRPPRNLKKLRTSEGNSRSWTALRGGLGRGWGTVDRDPAAVLLPRGRNLKKSRTGRRIIRRISLAVEGGGAGVGALPRRAPQRPSRVVLWRGARPPGLSWRGLIVLHPLIRLQGTGFVR